MPPREAARFEADLARVFRTNVRRDPKDLEREQLLQRHCPPALPPITIDRPSRPLKGRRRRQHTWAKSKPKQLRLPL
jgi:hypothetical protein